MSTVLILIFSLMGLAIAFAATIGALISRSQDRFPEGILIGSYIGSLGTVSLIALLMQTGLLNS